MTPVKHIYAAVAIVAAALIGGMALHAYIGSERDVARAEAVRQDVKQQIASLREDLQHERQKVEQDRKEAKTPQQIVQRLPQYVELPKPIYVQAPATQVSGVAGNSLPDAPSTGALVIPPESVKAFWEHETQCKADSLSLAECTKELPLVTKRAEFAEKAMKGGGFWKRAKSNGKWAAAGGGALLLTLCLTGHCPK